MVEATTKVTVGMVSSSAMVMSTLEIAPSAPLVGAPSVIEQASGLSSSASLTNVALIEPVVVPAANVTVPFGDVISAVLPFAFKTYGTWTARNEAALRVSGKVTVPAVSAMMRVAWVSVTVGRGSSSRTSTTQVAFAPPMMVQLTGAVNPTVNARFAWFFTLLITVNGMVTVVAAIGIVAVPAVRV